MIEQNEHTFANLEKNMARKRAKIKNLCDNNCARDKAMACAAKCCALNVAARRGEKMKNCGEADF